MNDDRTTNIIGLVAPAINAQFSVLGRLRGRLWLRSLGACWRLLVDGCHLTLVSVRKPPGRSQPVHAVAGLAAFALCLTYTGTRPSTGTPLARAAVSKYPRTSALAGITI